MRKSTADEKAKKIPKTIPGQTPTARGSAQPHIFEQEAITPTEPSPGEATEIDLDDPHSGDRSSAPKRGAMGDTKPRQTSRASRANGN
jgi:hypothetical protein